MALRKKKDMAEREVREPVEPTLADVLAAVQGIASRVSELEAKTEKAEATPKPAGTMSQLTHNELAVIATRDPVAIRAFADDVGKQKKWSRENVNDYAGELLRVAMNQANHDPDGDRQTVAEAKVKKTVEQAFTFGGQKHVAKVELF